MHSWLDTTAQTVTDRSSLFDETETHNFTLPSPLRPSHPSDDAKHAPAQLARQRQTCHDTSNIQDLHHSTGHIKQVFKHQPRESIPPDISDIQQKTPLNLPRPSDSKAWSALNAELEKTLTQTFNTHTIKHTPSSELMVKLDDYLYDFFLEKCGTIKPRSSKTNPSKKTDAKMLEFRKRKRLCRKTWRKYKKQNLTHTPEAKQIKKNMAKISPST